MVRDTQSEDLHWLQTNYAELTATYPMEWIAVREGKILAHGTNRRSVEEEASRTEHGDDFVVFFVERTPMHQKAEGPTLEDWNPLQP